MEATRRRQMDLVLMPKAWVQAPGRTFIPQAGDFGRFQTAAGYCLGFLQDDGSARIHRAFHSFDED